MAALDNVCSLLSPFPWDGRKASSVCDEDELLSPFIAYQDDHPWPHLYSEIDEMLESCVLIYPLADLRRLAREGKLKDESLATRMLTTPLTHADIMAVVESEKAALQDTHFSQQFYLDILKTMEERNMSLTSSLVDEMKGPARLTPSTIVAFDDEFEQEELVYDIELNHARKRITVCFRGSITKTDWATNFEIYQKEIANPMQAHSSQEPTVRVHNGFHDYLFQRSTRGAKGPFGEALSEYQEILLDHVMPVVKEYPKYKLYVTGHSLGAALATLFAFQAASEPDSVMPKPVSLFTFGAPYVGDDSFRSAHQLLEGLGKLRHLRVTNHKDIVTSMPKVSFKWNVFDSSAHVGTLFKHVGMNMRLYNGSEPFQLVYPRVRTGFFSGAFDEISIEFGQSLFSNLSWNPIDLFTWPVHSLREHNTRLDANKPTLEAIYLNDLYSRKDIVGNLVAQF